VQEGKLRSNKIIRISHSISPLLYGRFLNNNTPEYSCCTLRLWQGELPLYIKFTFQISRFPVCFRKVNYIAINWHCRQNRKINEQKDEKSYASQRYKQSILIQPGCGSPVSNSIQCQDDRTENSDCCLCNCLVIDLLKRKVNIMRIPFILSITLLLQFSTQLCAGEKILTGTPLSKSHTGKVEKKWYYPFEISELKIKQTNDGSGIIKDVTCRGCDYQFVKITANTKVFVNGKKVNLLRARERAGQQAYIEFDRDTAEVKHISWSE